MEVRTVSLAEAHGHILLHNISDGNGRKRVKKGMPLGDGELAILHELGIEQVEVAVLNQADLREDEAAERIARALTAEDTLWRCTRSVGGRVNLHTEARALLQVDVPRLQALNELPGVTLATRAPFTPLGPDMPQGTQAATLKIIPYALDEAAVNEAERWAEGILGLTPLPAQRVALLLSASEAVAPRLLRQFTEPTVERLRRWGSELTTTETVPQTETAIAGAAERLLASHDGLILAGQTSIMDLGDRPLRALRRIGVEIALHGAPVEPGNLLALGYRGKKWIMGAPGCARSPSHNVVDLVLPRLIAGERLGQREVAALGLGGLL